ncbi:MAG: methyl-accepting chemotaxis protein, partial [Betaproteobacteria bacterium HGW-Betaproteobacteria-6]
MNFLTQMKIGPRLALAFGAVIALAVAVVLIGITRMATVTGSLSLIGNDRVPKVQMMADLTDDANIIARELRNALIWDDPTKVNAALEQAAKARDAIGPIVERLSVLVTSDEGRKDLAALAEARAAFLPVQAQFIELVKGGKKAEAVALLDEKFRPAQLAYMKAIDQITDYQIQLVTKAATDGESLYATSRLIMAGLLLGMALVGTLFGWIITRSITRPIAQAVAVAEKVAAGDLSSHIEVNSRDETGQLLTALKGMNTELVRIVSTVRASSDSIATGSAQIATGNSDLSQRTEEQAANLQQTAASMEQISSTVRNSADT